MPRTSPLVALVLAAGSVSSIANAQSWANPVDGSWFTAANWSPMVVPTGNAATGTLGLAGPYTVTTTNNTLMGVNITNPAAVLALNGGNTLVLDGAVNNALNGTIRVNTAGSFQGTHLNIVQPNTLFSGTGSIQLNASGSDGAGTSQTATLDGAGTLTMGAGTSLRGFGMVLSLATTNNGVFTADVPGRPLRIEGATHQNNALYTAANGGVLVLVNTTLNQSGSGSIAPVPGSSAQIHGTAINGGTITSTATSRVSNSGSGTSTLSGVTINGGMDLDGNSNTFIGAPGVVLAGGATVKVNTNSAFQGTHVRTNAPNTPISGSGTLRLAASTSDGATTSLTAAISEGGGGTGSYVFGAGVSVAGFGIVNNVATTNHGTFNADVTGRPLRVEANFHQNNGLYTATNGGVLLLSNIALTQSPGAVISAVGASGDGTVNSNAQLSNTSVTGGSIVSNGASHAQLNGSTSATLSGVAVAGAFDQYGGSNLYIDSPGVTLSGGATILVNAGASFQGTHVRTGDTDTAINGNGTIRLNASGSDGATTSLTAAISEDGGDAGGSYVFAPGITVAGFGIVNNVPTTNNGTFNADVNGRPLRVNGSSHQNNNLYTATNGGTLWLVSTTVTQAGGATVRAGDGSTVTLNSSRLNGGTLGSPAGGTGTTVLDNDVTLDGVAVSRQMTLNGSGTLTITGSGINLTNNALLTVNTGAAFQGTHIRTGGANTAINGNGTIRLNASGSDGATTSLTAAISEDGGAAGGSYVFAPGITVAGFGIVNNVPTTNNGVFNADVNGRPLRIESNTHQNNGAYAASNGGTLVVVGATVNQGGAGTVTAGDASGVVLSSATVNGGTLNAGGSGRFTVNGVTAVSGVTSNAPIDIVGSDNLVVGPAGLVNNGLIVVNSNAAFAGTAFRAGVPNAAVSGSGEVRLNRSGSDGSATSGTADIEASAAGNSFSFGAGQTITGSGRLDGPVSMAGTISPGAAAGAVSFIRNEAALGFTDSGRLRIDIADGATFDRLVNTGSVALDGTLQVVSAMDFPAGTTFDVITGG
ncbi:MAG TPA: hypothetical protein VFF65_13975, partial [Phycisphaerales bacterium]|nr:hypothetical protein [Phycisphaerales bacterium]